MRLSIRERMILTGCVNDLLRLQAEEIEPGGWYPERDAQMEAQQEGAVRCDAGRWLRCTLESPSMRMGVARSCKRLEDLGLVEQLCWGYDGARRTHLRPTDAGIELAKSLMEESGNG